MSKKELQDIRNIVIFEMAKRGLSKADVVRLLEKRKFKRCSRANFYKFMAGAELGHEKIAEVFNVLALEIISKV